MGKMPGAGRETGPIVAHHFLIPNERSTSSRPTLPPLHTPQGPDVLGKYVALYAAQLIKSNAALTALQLFSKYGTPPSPQVHVHTHHNYNGKFGDYGNLAINIGIAKRKNIPTLI